LAFSRIGNALLAGLNSRSATNVLGFVSVLPKDGVSTICVGIARELTSHGRVLLVDASRDRSAISAWLNVEQKPPGAHDIPLSLSDWIAHSETGIDVALVDPVGDSAAVLETALAEKRSKVATRYRFVVVDLGSLQTLRTVGWATHLHRVYVVVDGSRTSSETLGRARKELDLLKFPVAGAIMNRRAPSMGSYFHRSVA
jgi:Mrp family chromosome partitioning ATPase